MMRGWSSQTHSHFWGLSLFTLFAKRPIFDIIDLYDLGAPPRPPASLDAVTVALGTGPPDCPAPSNAWLASDAAELRKRWSSCLDMLVRCSYGYLPPLMHVNALVGAVLP